MVIETIKEIKDRGIKNIIDENIELVKELGLLGAIKAKTEHIKEHVLGTAQNIRSTVIGKKIGSSSPYEIPEEYPPAPEAPESKEITEKTSSSGKFKIGI